ncbi:S1C family serine protease [Alkalilimnicola ehrlichii MLHE-1]|uniref:Peptidase S1 and S6, chymotrypsin/Hap n=1 Tax=Alkalilimnicola ehrlichii (strain ATCC BAA-1101 / DSM 17681 / MLHE-1) TaxID=187272 RepID=Q0ACI3_ALKEH|nr:serine protease [Alkalilimnicola ehrlichii]ABI55454.1 peptidase S1 and S6, chymotrypsin/Hap [Alkalilimnicola ehrlichii MLHE-1]
MPTAVRCHHPVPREPAGRRCRAQGWARWLLLAAVALALLLVLLLVPRQAQSERLPDTVERVEPAIVSVATHQPARSPRLRHLGTGFAVADGRLVATNLHVLPDVLDRENQERLVVVTGSGRNTEVRSAERVAASQTHDLALLRISGTPLPALSLGDSDAVRTGERLAFTGFPIGMILGMYPATHRASVSARTPMALPAGHSRQLDERRVAQLRRNPPMVFQLDGTAYPGNSGSPLFRIDSGEVVGIINQVFVQGGREAAVGSPSGISYAVPSGQLRALIEGHRD